MRAVLAACGLWCSCQSGLCCCGQVCSLVEPRSGNQRLPYLALFAFTCMFMLAVRIFAQPFLANSSTLSYLGLHLCSDGDSACFANQFVFRVSFALMLFHGAIALTQLIPNIANPCHNQCFPVKAALLSGLSLFTVGVMPAKSVFIYGNVARWISLLYLVLQNVLFIDFAFTLNERLVEEGVTSRCKVGLLTICALIYAGIFIAWIFLFASYVAPGGYKCNLNSGFITSHIILVIVSTLLSIWSETAGSIVQCTVVSCSTLLLLYTALNKDPTACNLNQLSPEVSAFQAFLALALTMASTTWSAWRMGDSSAGPQLLGATQPNDEDTFGYSIEFNTNNELSHDIRMGNLFFQTVLAMAAAFSSMILSNWGTVSSNELDILHTSHQSQWANMLSLYIVSLLYIWALIAPLLFPNRIFSST